MTTVITPSSLRKYSLSLLTESSNSNLVVIDIQPASKNYINFNLDDFFEFIKEYNNVYYFFNGEDIGMDSLLDMERFFIEYDELDLFNNIIFIEKDYAFIRDAMDDGLDYSLIEESLTKLLELDVYNIRDLDPEDITDICKKVNIELNDADCNHLMEIRDEGGISLPVFIDDVKRLPKSFDLVGGGYNECLGEMKYLFEVLGYKYNEINSFIY